MKPSPDQEIVLARRPAGRLTLDCFDVRHVSAEPMAAGMLRIRVRYLSIDPYMRGLMDGDLGFAAPLALGQALPGEAVGDVIESADARFGAGDLVLCHAGWRTVATLPANECCRLDPDIVAPTTSLGILGAPGFSAWLGMMVLAPPAAGETVVVAAAAGPVGSAVVQFARNAGAHVTAIAGGAAKCDWLRTVLKADHVIDRHDSDFSIRLRDACPRGIDVYFENVGGIVWNAVFPLLNRHARVPVCGLVSGYDGGSNQNGNSVSDDAILAAALARSLTIRGFVNFDFRAKYFDDFLRLVTPEVASGRLIYREDIVDGLDMAPCALIDLLAGANFGKQIIRL